MPAGEQIAFEPALAQVLGQDLHHPAVRARWSSSGRIVRHPGAVGDLEDVLQPVGRGLVGADDAEVASRR